ncbi:DMT family transporter [Polaribacter sp.]|nr:DMT family transporter [Polaribacter sp.]
MKAKRDFWIGILIGILAVALFSSKAVMVKLAYQYNVDAITILLLRMLFAFPFYVIIAFKFRKQKENITKKDYAWLILFGLVGYYLASYFDFEGLSYIKASLERIILFLYPTIVLFLNRIFLKKPITKVQILAILLTYVGVVIAFVDELEFSGNAVYKGVFFIVLSAITYASYLVGSGWLIPKFGVMKFTANAMLVSCFSVFIHFTIVSDVALLGLPWQVYAYGGLIAIFATVIPSFLVSKSIKMISSSNFAIVAGIGPISTIILATVFLDEVLTFLQMVGALVVITGIVILSLKKEKSKK